MAVTKKSKYLPTIFQLVNELDGCLYLCLATPLPLILWSGVLQIVNIAASRLLRFTASIVIFVNHTLSQTCKLVALNDSLRHVIELIKCDRQMLQLLATGHANINAAVSKGLKYIDNTMINFFSYHVGEFVFVLRPLFSNKLSYFFLTTDKTGNVKLTIIGRAI